MHRSWVRSAASLSQLRKFCDHVASHAPRDEANAQGEALKPWDGDSETLREACNFFRLADTSAAALTSLVASVENMPRLRNTSPSSATLENQRRILLAVFTPSAGGSTAGGGDAAPSFVDIYNPTTRRMVLTRLKLQQEGEADTWDICTKLALELGGCARGVIIPVVESPEMRVTIAKDRQALAAVIKEHGVGFTLEIDSLELTLLDRRSNLHLRHDEALALTPEMRAMKEWRRLCEFCASTRAGADPAEVIAMHTAPTSHIYVISLWTFGGRTDHLVLLDPKAKGRRHCSGAMSEILHELLNIPFASIVFIPTTRTDRAILLSVCSALQRQGRIVSIVFPNEIIPSATVRKKKDSDANNPYDYVFENDAEKMWARLLAVEGLSQEEMLWRVSVTSGSNTRKLTFLNRRRVEDNSRALLAEQAAATSAPESSTRSSEEATAEVARESPLAGPDAWLAHYFQNNAERQASEKSAADSLLKNPLFISYVATQDTYFERPANPAAQENFIVVSAYDDERKVPLLPLKVLTSRAELSLPSLEGYSVIVAHDAKSLLLLAQDCPELATFIKRGGKVWCVALAEYLISAQRIRSSGNSLQQLGARYSHSISCPELPAVRSKEVLLDDQTVSIGHYRQILAAHVTAIREVFHGQVQQATSQSQLVSISCRMDALLAFYSMERHGIFVDKDIATEQARKLRNNCTVLESMLNAHIPQQIPIDLQHRFCWSDWSHVTAYYFGGEVNFSQSAVSMSHDNTRCIVPFLVWYGDIQVAPNITEAKMTGFLSRFRTPEAERPHATPAALTEATSATATRSSLKNQPPRAHQQYEEIRSICRKKDFCFPNKHAVRVVFLDVESTGLNALSDSIVELAVVDLFEGTHFLSRVNPGCKIPRDSTRIHGITNEQAAMAPQPADVAKRLAAYLRITSDTAVPGEMTIIMSHATFQLDQPLFLRLLRSHCPEADTSSLLFADSLRLFRLLREGLLSEKRGGGGGADSVERLLKRAKGMRLETIAEALRVTTTGKKLHSARGDAEILAQCVLRASGAHVKLTDANKGKAREAICRLLGLAGSRHGGIFAGEDTTTLNARLNGVLADFGLRENSIRRLRRENLNSRFLKTMEKLGCRVAPLLLQLRKFESLNDKFLLCDPRGALRVLHPDGFTRQLIDLTGTVTSRTASVHPSCQNIPKDDPSKIRRIFSSRFGSDGVCAEIDYSQLEIVVMANLCGDETLAKELNAGVDFHCARASMYCGMSYDSLLNGYRTGDKQATLFRKQAKTFTFQRLYGAGVNLIHKTTKLPKETIEKMIEQEERKYPKMKQFTELVRATAARPGNPGLPTHFVFELPTGCRIAFKTLDVMRNLPPVKNYPIQGFGAEVAQIMIGRVSRMLFENNFYDQRCFLTNFVHDSLWLDCHKDVVKEASESIARVMSEVDTVFPKLFPGVTIPVPLKVTIMAGPDMQSLEKIAGADVEEPADSPLVEEVGCDEVDEDESSGVDSDEAS